MEKTYFIYVNHKATGAIFGELVKIIDIEKEFFKNIQTIVEDNYTSVFIGKCSNIEEAVGKFKELQIVSSVTVGEINNLNIYY